MAKRIEGVTEKLLECAKREFLEKGYQNASLRTITQNADTTTRAVYTRYSGKEGLFSALVCPAADGLKELLLSIRDDFSELPGDIQKEVVKDDSNDKFPQFMEYIYAHFDDFKLLITCSAGTSYENYIHDLVEIDVRYNLKFFKATGISKRCTPELMHILSSAFFSGIFEVVIHDMSREDAENHIARLRRFFAAGWNTIL